jgi:hypothetical protein
MASINMPSRRPDAIERLAQGLGIAHAILGIGQAIGKAATDAEDRSKLAQLDDPNSEASKQKYVSLKTSGLTVPEGLSANEYEKNRPVYEKSYELGLKGERPSEDKGVLGADKLADFQSKGLLVPPGSKNALTMDFLLPGGKRAQYGVLTAPKEPKAAQEEFKTLPIENQKQIELLATKKATKQDIRDQIQASLAQLESPDLSEDQKVQIGREMLKTLNSLQGSDAIGSEEAQRLGSFLEYKIANFRQPGSFVGRDLDLFTKQVGLNLQKIDSSIESNQREIDKLYGRATQEPARPDFKRLAQPKKDSIIPEAMATPGKTSFNNEDLEALDWVKKNPKDPRAGAIMERLKGKGLR